MCHLALQEEEHQHADEVSIWTAPPSSLSQGLLCLGVMSAEQSGGREGGGGKRGEGGGREKEGKRGEGGGREYKGKFYTGLLNKETEHIFHP